MLAAMTACSTNDSPWNIDPTNPDSPVIGGGGGSTADDGDTPSFDPTISAWNGQKATDGATDAVGSDKDFYHELNTFKNTVEVVYDGSTATVTSSNANILIHQEGAYVTVDMATNAVDKTHITISGKSSDGGLKVYSSNKFMLTLNGVELTSQLGPAINSQCKKRIYVHLADGTSNVLTDAASYSSDPYYLDGNDADGEDRKGCFFSEGNLIFSGTGVLQITGKKKHGLCTDGYLYIRPGVTLVVNDAAKNAIHVKGDTDDGYGVYIAGGLIYTYTSSTAGKGIKCDINVDILGGQLELNTAGGSTYDEDDADTSSAAAIKTDTDVNISGGTLVLKSTGTGGKGINADGAINISGGVTTVTTTGGKYYYTQSLTSSPKGVKADGNINISGGTLNIAVTGQSDSSEGLESKASINITDGSVYVYAYEDAINAATAFNVSGGDVYAYSSSNDGIDSNGSLTISGGKVIGIGGNSPEGGIDCDSSSRFFINGGEVYSMGGSLQSSPSSSSKQMVVVLNGISVSKGATLTLTDSSDKTVFSISMPRSLSGGNFTFSLPALTSGTKYTLKSGSTTLTTITPSSTITTIGSSTNGGGGAGGGFGPR